MTDLRVELTRELAYRYHDTIVPIFTDSPSSNVDAELCGSAFIGCWKNHLVLVTAAHVVKAIVGRDVRVIVVKGHSAFLRNVPFAIDDENDLAVADFTTAALDLKDIVSTTKAVPIGRDFVDRERLPFGIALGFPGTKNRLKTKYSKTDRFLYAFDMPVPDQSVPVKTEIPASVQFLYDPKACYDHLGKKVTPPDPHGMSGCPAFSIYPRLHAPHQVGLAGVIAEWHSAQKVIISSPEVALVRLLESLLPTSK